MWSTNAGGAILCLKCLAGGLWLLLLVVSPLSGLGGRGFTQISWESHLDV